MHRASRLRPALSTAAALLCLLLVSSAAAGTLLVPEDHGLESALAAAGVGDTISVAPGALTGGRAELVGGVVLLSREEGANRLNEIRAEDLAPAAEVVGFAVTGEEQDPFTRRGGILLRDGALILRHCVVDSIDGGVEGIWGGLGHDGGYPMGWPVTYEGACELRLEDCRIRALSGICPVVDCVGGPAIGRGDAGGTLDLTLRRCVVEDQADLIGGRATVLLEDSRFRRCTRGIVEVHGDVTMLGCVVSDSRPAGYWGVPLGEPHVIPFPLINARDGRLEAVGNTFVDCVVWEYGYYDDGPSTLPIPLLRTVDSASRIENNLFVGMTGPVLEAPAGVAVLCNDVWDGPAELWIGGVDDPVGQDGNLAAAPLFCDRVGGDYRVCDDSPAATAACGPMGALGVGCLCEVPVAVRAFTARWEGEAVAVSWELAGVSEVVVRRVRPDGTAVEVYRGGGAGFVDRAVGGGTVGLRYGLGRIGPDGVEVFPVAWAAVEGTPAVGRTRLLGAVPNPFNPSTLLRFALGAPGDAVLTVHDGAGRRVRSWRWTGLAAGEHEVKWEGRDAAGQPVAAGVYHLRLESGGRVDGGRVVLLK